MLITITKNNGEFDILMEHDLMKGSGRDADLMTAFNSVAPRFAHTTRIPIASIEDDKAFIETWLNDLELQGKVMIQEGMPTRYGTKDMKLWT